jgi:hypothetical protein
MQLHIYVYVYVYVYMHIYIYTQYVFNKKYFYKNTYINILETFIGVKNIGTSYNFLTPIYLIIIYEY